MKDIKTLYLDAKARGTPSAISAYTEAVHTLLESNPQEYYSELGYIIKSSIGLSTFQTFVEKWGLPIPAYGTVMAMMEECKNDCEKQDKDASKYEEAIQYLEGFRAKHPHCFAIYEMCMDNSEAARDTLGPDAKLPLKMESNEEYIQRYYSINEKSGIQGRKTLPKRGDMSMARIPDVIITAASMNESAMNTVCEYFQGMYALNLPARYTNQTLCECAKDFPDVKCSAITGILEQGLDIDHMIQSAQARNYQIFRESALMQNESAKQYLTEDEVIAVQNMISILEYTVLEQSGQAATDTQNRIYSLYEMLDGYIDDQGNVIAESVETLEENPLITEAEEIAQYFQTLSIIDESVEPFMEVSRGKLQVDYRAGVDIKTGHPVQIIYSLDNIKLTDVGYYRDPDSGDYPMHHQDLIDTAQKNIRKRGNLDHQSKGQKVLAIKDLYEVQKQKGSKKKDKSKIYLDEVECIGIFNIKGVSQKALKDPKKMQEEIASSKGRIKTFKVKVGQVDNDPSYKSTYWPKSSASKTQSSVSREVAYREHFKYGRGSEIKKVADIIDLFHDYTSIMEIGRGLWGIKLMHADSDYTDTPADQQVTVAVFLSTGVRHMSDHHDFRKMPAAQQNARYQTCLTAISKILTSLNHKHHLTKGGWGTKDDAKYGYIGSYFHELAEKGDAKAAKELERKVRHELEKVQHDKKHLPESIYKKLLGQMRELDMMIHRAYNLYFKDAIAKKDAKELKKPKLESYEFDEFEPDYSPMTESEAIVTGAAYLGALMCEDVADAILPMLPSAGAATEAAPWMMNTMNKKLGTTPTYLARNHNMGYGEDDKSSGSDDDDDDSSHDHSLDDFARKPSSDDEGDTSGDGDDSVKATEPESPVVTPQSTAAANYYYYTYNNSLNQNKNSFNKDSSTHDDHSRHSKTDDHSVGKRISSDNNIGDPDDDYDSSYHALESASDFSDFKKCSEEECEKKMERDHKCTENCKHAAKKLVKENTKLTWNLDLLTEGVVNYDTVQSIIESLRESYDVPHQFGDRSDMFTLNVRPYDPFMELGVDPVFAEPFVLMVEGAKQDWNRECHQFQKMFGHDLNKLGDINSPPKKITITMNGKKMVFHSSRGYSQTTGKRVERYAQVPTSIHNFNVNRDDIIADKIGIADAVMHRLKMMDYKFDSGMSFADAVKKYGIAGERIIFKQCGEIGLTFTTNIGGKRIGINIDTDLDVSDGDAEVAMESVMTEYVADTDENRPESDHPIRDALMDIDRKTVAGQQKAKKKVREFQQAGRAFMKPVNRSMQWIGNMVHEWKDADETKVKEKLADPHVRNGLFGAISSAVKYGALAKAGLLFNPIFLFLSVTRKMGNDKKIARMRNEMLGEIDAEIEILQEKINQAEKDKKPKEKYRLIRFKKELEKKKLRVGGGTKIARIL